MITKNEIIKLADKIRGDFAKFKSNDIDRAAYHGASQALDALIKELPEPVNEPIPYHISYHFQSANKTGFGDFVASDVYVGVQAGDIKEVKRRARVHAMEGIEGATMENTTAVIISITKLMP